MPTGGPETQWYVCMMCIFLFFFPPLTFHVYLCMCTCVGVRVYPYKYARVYMHVHMDVCIQVYIYIYFILFYLFIYYGCAGSSLLCAGPPQLQRAGATPRCSVQASHHSGLSCYGARAPGTRAPAVVAYGLQSAGSAAVTLRSSCSTACGIPPDQGSNPCPSHWQTDF